MGEKTNQREGERKRGEKESLNKHKSYYSELSYMKVHCSIFWVGFQNKGSAGGRK
jgi:hypothetical protein